MGFEFKWLEWILVPLLTFIGAMYRYFKSLKKFSHFTWLALFVQTLGAISMGLVLYFVGKWASIPQAVLCSIGVLTGMWGESAFRHFIQTYTKIPLPD